MTIHNRAHDLVGLDLHAMCANQTNSTHIWGKHILTKRIYEEQKNRDIGDRLM